MKKLILFLFLIQSNLLFSQIRVNQDSVNYYFQEIVNNYRAKYNLSPLSVESGFKSFTDSWSKYMLVHNYCGHGEGTYTFRNRILRFDTTNPNVYYLENCAGPWNFVKELPSEPDDVNYKYYTKTITTPDGKKIDYKYKLTVSEIKRLCEIEDEISLGINLNENMAWYVFYLWKNSPEHNDGLLDPKTNKFYVSICLSGTNMSSSYLASN